LQFALQKGRPKKRKEDIYTGEMSTYLKATKIPHADAEQIESFEKSSVSFKENCK
jgi:hypothetical protein